MVANTVLRFERNRNKGTKRLLDLQMNKQNKNWKTVAMKMNKECKNTRKKTKQHRS
jgi:hypothetical protein